jgi:hypothetical protein
MRSEMLRSRRFDAGFFIGGMEGVEEEFSLFRNVCSTAAFWPIKSTGAAAAILYTRHAGDVLNQPPARKLGHEAERLLSTSLVYRQVVRTLLDAS